MALQLPSSFADTLRSKFSSSRESGALVFTESTVKNVVDGDILFEIRVAPSLSKKSTLRTDSDTKNSQSASKQKFNPFLNPDPELLLAELGQDYKLVLNKFSIVPYHFLCITSQFKPQNAPLSEEDLAAAWACLQAPVPDDTKGKQWLAFYNCGEQSGASQAHRHVQFIPVDSSAKLLPDVALTYGVSESQDAIGQFPTFDPTVPFTHFVLPVPPSPTPDDLIMRFSSLLARTLTALREHSSLTSQISGISFNFAMTKQWMYMAPRSRETYAHDDLELSVNATGMVGMLLAKSESELDIFEKVGVLEILKTVGVEKVKQDEKHHDY
ncbi:HIT-like domain-containing protein [Kockiozyma suomiensis]|uniref:HIT-like domain-containing protein n=1 Tax=Kockiozyma suomiensis TaxID=1337062 RepID=UPI003343411A